MGHFDFASDSMDTCIAIRTMTFKEGVAYLQAGGGIVFDSVEEDEYVETINKLGANVKCLEQAEGELSFGGSWLREEECQWSNADPLSLCLLPPAVYYASLEDEE